jgi:multidrug efflux pump subunit AcrA (membrane-fusion protein)
MKWPATKRARIAAGAVVLALAAIAQRAASSAPDLPTATVRQGTFEDVLTLRGEIKPSRSLTLAAPARGSDLRILRIARTGTRVNAGDTVIEFDRSTVLRTLGEKESELKRAEAEIDRIQAQRRIAEQELLTSVQKSRFDLERAKLDASAEDLLSKVEFEQRRLAVSDAESALRAMEQKLEAERQAANAELKGARQKRDKARLEVDDARGQLQQLSIAAPRAGIVTVLQNFRSGGAGGTEFREGDRPWNGAPLAELPDLSTVVLVAKLDESERARLKPQQPATVRIDALPDKDFDAGVSAISALTRADFSSWPPLRHFEAIIALAAVDPRLRPGMNGTARLVLDRVAGATLVPVKALFALEGDTVCYVRASRAFSPRRVKVARRGSEDAIVDGLRVGDVVALERPAS